ncbi:MAG: hypothetical protein ACI8PQ_001032 [Planctomycetota bacterium]|jgi:hypothetical protein
MDLTRLQPALVLALAALLTPVFAQEQAADAEPPLDSFLGGVRINEPEALGGYTLFAPLRSHTTYLVDMEGEVAHTWESDLPPGQAVYLTDEGHLFRSGRVSHDLFHGGGQGGRLQEFSWDGELLWDAILSNETHHAHHDFALLPNGNVLVLAWEKVSPADAVLLGRDPKTINQDEGLWPDAIFELKPQRPAAFEVVWEWHAQDHLVQDLFPQGPNYGDVIDNPRRIDINFDVRSDAPLTAQERERLEREEAQMRAIGYVGEDDDGGGSEGPLRADWMHSNGIDFLPSDNLILVSSRAMSEVFVIDHSTTTREAASSSGGTFGQGGDLLYRWGNPKNYGLGDTPDQTLFVQHNAEWIRAAGGELRFLVFDNGGGRPGGEYSEIDEVQVPFNAHLGFRRDAGQPFEPAEPEWSYGAAEDQRFFSPFVSGTQRLPNGNTLICAGVEGRVFEVTTEGRMVWDFQNPFGGDVPLMEPRKGPGGEGPPPMPDDLAKKGLFRATRLAAEHPGLARLSKNQ